MSKKILLIGGQQWLKTNKTQAEMIEALKKEVVKRDLAASIVQQDDGKVVMRIVFPEAPDAQK